MTVDLDSTLSRFVIPALLLGFAIVGFSLSVGGAYIISVEPDKSKVTPEMFAATGLVIFTSYQIIVGIPMLYIALMKKTAWKLRLLLFAVAPPTISFLVVKILPWTSLFFLWAIASLAAYESGVYYRRIQARAKEKLKQPLH